MDLNEYRKKHFGVELESARYSDYEGEMVVKITTNGYQWTCVCLTPDEMHEVIDLLSGHLSSIESKQEGEDDETRTR